MTKQNDKPAKAQLKENGSELKQNDPSDKLEQAAEVRMDELVNRFLTWALPKSVCADRCATVYDYPHDRSGTNLLNADEAREMLEHVLSGYRHAEVDELKAKLEKAMTICGLYEQAFDDTGNDYSHLVCLQAARAALKALGEK